MFLLICRDQDEANQIFHLVASLLPADAQMTSPKHKQLLSRLLDSLHEELSILERFAATGIESLENTSELEAQDSENADQNIAGSTVLDKDKVEFIRREFQKKRKRNEMLDCSSIRLGSRTYMDYLSAAENSDNIAEMLYSLKL